MEILDLRWAKEVLVVAVDLGGDHSGVVGVGSA